MPPAKQPSALVIPIAAPKRCSAPVDIDIYVIHKASKPGVSGCRNSYPARSRLDSSKLGSQSILTMHRTASRDWRIQLSQSNPPKHASSPRSASLKVRKGTGIPGSRTNNPTHPAPWPELRRRTLPQHQGRTIHSTMECTTWTCLLQTSR